MASVSDIRELVLDSDPRAADPGTITVTAFYEFIIEESRAALRYRCDRLIEESAIFDSALKAEMHATFQRAFTETVLPDLGAAVAEMQVRLLRYPLH
jgi:hypothetical protein